MLTNNLFGNNIEPACSYCQHGKPSSDQVMVACNRYGPVAPNYNCKHFFYSPLKRIPKRQPPLPAYNPEDFKL